MKKNLKKNILITIAAFIISYIIAFIITNFEIFRIDNKGKINIPTNLISSSKLDKETIVEINIDKTYVGKFYLDLKKSPAIGKRHQKADVFIPYTMLRQCIYLMKSSFDYLVADSIIDSNHFHSLVCINPNKQKENKSGKI